MEYVDVITMITAAGALVVSLITYQKTVLHDRKKDTLEAYNTLQEQALDHINNYKEREIKAFVNSDDKEMLNNLGRWLARIEHFCVGVNQKIYDKDTVYELAHGYLDLSIWHKLRPVIEKKQAGKNEKYYENFEAVVSFMRNKSKKAH